MLWSERKPPDSRDSMWRRRTRDHARIQLQTVGAACLGAVPVMEVPGVMERVI